MKNARLPSGHQFAIQPCRLSNLRAAFVLANDELCQEREPNTIVASGRVHCLHLGRRELKNIMNRVLPQDGAGDELCRCTGAATRSPAPGEPGSAATAGARPRHDAKQAAGGFTPQVCDLRRSKWEWTNLHFAREFSAEECAEEAVVDTEKQWAWD